MITSLLRESGASTGGEDPGELTFRPRVNAKANAKLVGERAGVVEASAKWLASRNEKVASLRAALEAKRASEEAAELTFSPTLLRRSKPRKGGNEVDGDDGEDDDENETEDKIAPSTPRAGENVRGNDVGTTEREKDVYTRLYKSPTASFRNSASPYAKRKGGSALITVTPARPTPEEAAALAHMYETQYHQLTERDKANELARAHEKLQAEIVVHSPRTLRLAQRWWARRITEAFAKVEIASDLVVPSSENGGEDTQRDVWGTQVEDDAYVTPRVLVFEVMARKLGMMFTAPELAMVLPSILIDLEAEEEGEDEGVTEAVPSSAEAVDTSYRQTHTHETATLEVLSKFPRKKASRGNFIKLVEAALAHVPTATRKKLSSNALVVRSGTPKQSSPVRAMGALTISSLSQEPLGTYPSHVLEIVREAVAHSNSAGTKKPSQQEETGGGGGTTIRRTMSEITALLEATQRMYEEHRQARRERIEEEIRAAHPFRPQISRERHVAQIDNEGEAAAVVPEEENEARPTRGQQPRGPPVYVRLYAESSRWKEHKKELEEERARELELREASECTFSPRINEESTLLAQRSTLRAEDQLDETEMSNEEDRNPSGGGGGLVKGLETHLRRQRAGREIRIRKQREREEWTREAYTLPRGEDDLTELEAGKFGAGFTDPYREVTIEVEYRGERHQVVFRPYDTTPQRLAREFLETRRLERERRAANLAATPTTKSIRPFYGPTLDSRESTKTSGERTTTPPREARRDTPSEEPREEQENAQRWGDEYRALGGEIAGTMRRAGIRFARVEEREEDYELHFDHGRERWYFYNAITDESTWRKPDIVTDVRRLRRFTGFEV